MKKGVSKVKLEGLKPGDLAYHQKWGYLKLDKYLGVFDLELYKHDHALSDWECSLLVPRVDAVTGDTISKIHIHPKDLQFFITVNVLSQLEKRVSTCRLIVNVHDAIKTHVSALASFSSADYVVTYKG